MKKCGLDLQFDGSTLLPNASEIVQYLPVARSDPFARSALAGVPDDRGTTTTEYPVRRFHLFEGDDR